MGIEYRLLSRGRLVDICGNLFKCEFVIRARRSHFLCLNSVTSNFCLIENKEKIFTFNK